LGGRTVGVAARLGLRDWSGDWDDEYGGSITAVVLAGLVFLEPPLPSGEGAIIDEQGARSATGAEMAVHLPPHPDWDRMEVVHGSVGFAPFSGSGPRSAASDVAFAQPVNLVAGLLTGVDVQFSASDGDHHLSYLEVRLNTARLDAQRARVTASFGLRDASGWWDDRYEGTVSFSVVGE